MPRPLGMDVFTVTYGPARSTVKDSGLAMRVKIRPSISVVWAETGTPLIAFWEDVTADPGAQGEVVLPSPDQDGFIDSNGNAVRNFTYDAQVDFVLGRDVKQQARKTFTHYASMPDTIDLDTLIPVAGTAGTLLAITVPAAADLDGDELVLTTVDGIEMARWNVRGPRGYTGPHGNSVDVGQGPPTAPGSYVNSYIDAVTGDIYTWSTSQQTWGSPVGNLRGPAGPATAGYIGGTVY